MTAAGEDGGGVGEDEDPESEGILFLPCSPLLPEGGVSFLLLLAAGGPRGKNSWPWASAESLGRGFLKGDFGGLCCCCCCRSSSSSSSLEHFLFAGGGECGDSPLSSLELEAEEEEERMGIDGRRLSFKDSLVTLAPPPSGRSCCDEEEEEEEDCGGFFRTPDKFSKSRP